MCAGAHLDLRALARTLMSGFPTSSLPVDVQTLTSGHSLLCCKWLSGHLCTATLVLHPRGRCSRLGAKLACHSCNSGRLAAWTVRQPIRQLRDVPTPQLILQYFCDVRRSSRCSTPCANGTPSRPLKTLLPQVPPLIQPPAYAALPHATCRWQPRSICVALLCFDMHDPKRQTRKVSADRAKADVQL